MFKMQFLLHEYFEYFLFKSKNERFLLILATKFRKFYSLKQNIFSMDMLFTTYTENLPHKGSVYWISMREMLYYFKKNIYLNKLSKKRF